MDIFTKEVEIDCYDQAKVVNPKTKEEIEYNELLDTKIKKCHTIIDQLEVYNH